MSLFATVNSRLPFGAKARMRCSLELSKRIIKFTADGDGIGTYDIFQFQMLDSADRLDYLSIGEFTDSDQRHER